MILPVCRVKAAGSTIISAALGDESLEQIGEPQVVADGATDRDGPRNRS